MKQKIKEDIEFKIEQLVTAFQIHKDIVLLESRMKEQLPPYAIFKTDDWWQKRIEQVLPCEIRTLTDDYGWVKCGDYQGGTFVVARCDNCVLREKLIDVSADASEL